MSTERSKKQHRTAPTILWNDINDPGAYVTEDGNTLFRVQDDAVASGRSPRITAVSNESGTDGFLVAMISDNPNITLSKARQLCADSDIHPNF